MSNDPPFTTGQAAELCHVSQATIINWIKANKLNGYTTPGGHYRIPRSELISFLKRNGMPVSATLRRSARPRLLILSEDPTIRDLARSLEESGRLEACLVTSDYATSAEAVQSRPLAVIIDIRASSDPLGLCQWLSQTVDDVSLLLVGENHGEMTAQAVGADDYVHPNALARLEAKLEVLLQ